MSGVWIEISTQMRWNERGWMSIGIVEMEHSWALMRYFDHRRITVTFFKRAA
jgi:hypothetical protein